LVRHAITLIVDTPRRHTYISRMRFLPIGLLLALLCGCSETLVYAPPDTAAPPDKAADLFGPQTMRLHPIFTQVKSWTGSSAPDGVDAVLEFHDQFGDPTKAVGSVIFELYAYRTGFADHRGERVGQPWAASLSSVDEQKSHWRSEIGAYDFLLACEDVRIDRAYVLTATYEPPTGARLFTETVIVPQKKSTTTHPAHNDSESVFP